MSENEKNQVTKSINESQINSKNNKKKKIILKVFGITLVVGLFISHMYGNINEAQNQFTGVTSTLYSIEDMMKSRNQSIVEVKDSVYKFDEIKSAFDEFEKENTKLKKVMSFGKNTQEVNQTTKRLADIERSVDKILSIYTNSEEMKKDKKLAEKMDEIIASDYGIESTIKFFNDDELELFNEAIDNQPVKLMKSKYHIEKINKIEVK